MSYQSSLILAREKIHQAEKALEDYKGANRNGSAFDLEQAKQLIIAATRARSDYIDQLEMANSSGQSTLGATNSISDQ